MQNCDCCIKVIAPGTEIFVIDGMEICGACYDEYCALTVTDGIDIHKNRENTEKTNIKHQLNAL